jgi:hypothetical protein
MLLPPLKYIEPVIFFVYAAKKIAVRRQIIILKYLYIHLIDIIIMI